jgi:hypothetical protein
MGMPVRTRDLNVVTAVEVPHAGETPSAAIESTRVP